ncbi:MAG: hypothetical protein KGO49_08430 [Gammaproteobacteria bacterium]|nr:hypothetical protein [Gammaproteobacteria bacterium]
MQKVVLLGALLAAIFLGAIYIYSAESDIIRIQYTGERAIVDPIGDYDKTGMSFGEDIYSATFHFKTADGRTIDKERSFPSELIDDIKNNQPIVVCYRPNDPENFFFEKFQPSIFLFLFVILLFHIVAVAFQKALHELKAQRRKDYVSNIATYLERE